MRIRWGILRALATLTAGLLCLGVAGCGKKATTVSTPSIRESSAAELFGSMVPAKPDPKSVWSVAAPDYSGMAPGPGMFAFLRSNDNDDWDAPYEIWAVDANTGKKIWNAPTSSNTAIASDVDGPGVRSTGTIVAADIVGIPQDGLTPAQNRTDIVARNAADGKELWRKEVMRESVDAVKKQALVALAVRHSTTVVVTPQWVKVFETRTGAEGWSKEIPKAEAVPGDQQADEQLHTWTTVALSDSEVAAACQLNNRKAQMLVWDLGSGVQKWGKEATAPGDSYSTALNFTQIAIAGGRVMTTQLYTGQSEQRTLFRKIIAFKAADGKQAWEISDPPAEEVSFVLDESDGTLLRNAEKTLYAYNVNDGTPRWELPPEVKVEKIVSLSQLTFILATSGESRQVAVIRTRSKEQTGTLGAQDVVDLRVFQGAVALVSNDKVMMYH